MLSNPWMKFYPSDWRADPRLRMCTLSARGLWVEMLALMHEAKPYGHCLVNGLAPNDAQLAVLAGAPSDQVTELLGELEAAGVFSRTREGVIYSRRMTRDEKKSQTARKNGKRGGNPSLDKDTINPPSDKPPVKGSDKPQKPNARGQKEPLTPYGAGDAVNDWNDVASRLGLPQCKSVTKARRRAIGARLREFGEDGWKRALAAIDISPFHRGENERGWRVDIDYLARESGFIKLYERADAEKPPGTDWGGEVRLFQKFGDWRPDGPPPGQPGCQVPADVLAEFGYSVGDAA